MDIWSLRNIALDEAIQEIAKMEKESSISAEMKWALVQARKRIEAKKL